MRLLSQKAGLRYIIYAIGEILLVVIGILLALQINNWNDSRSQQNQIKTYLQNLTKSLHADVQYFGGCQYQNSSRINCFTYILRKADIDFREDLFVLHEDSDTATFWDGKPPAKDERAFIDLCFELSSRGGVQVINKSILEEFKSTGLFSYIKNDSLKTLINGYYSRFEWFFSEWLESTFRTHVDEWENFLRDKYSINKEETYKLKDPVDLVKYNADIQLEIKDLMNGALFRANGATRMIELAEELIRAIEVELQTIHN